MDFESLPSVTPSSEQDLDPKRNWLRIFRAGHVGAIAAGERFVESLDLGISEEFGVAEELNEYTNGWSNYTDVISNFFNDETNYDTFNVVYSQNIGPAIDRHSRKRRDDKFEKDFIDVATTYVVHGRMMRTQRGDLVEDVMQGSSVASVRSMIAEASKRIKVVTSKRDSIVTRFRQTPDALKIQKELEILSVDVERAYKPILKAEDTIIEKFQKQIAGNPQKAKRLLERFIQAHESEALDERIFVKFLSTEYAVNPNFAILSRAVETIKAGTEKGSIAKDFIEEHMAENQGNNLLQFFSDALVEQDIRTPFPSYMAGRFESWPQDLKDSYETFRSNFVASIGTTAQRIAAQNIEKLWVHPTLEMYEEMTERVNFRIHGKNPIAGKRVRLVDVSRVRVGASTILKTEDVLPDKRFEEEVKPRVPVVIARGIEGKGAVWGEESTVDAIIEKLIPHNKKNNSGFKDEVRKIVEKLTHEPFGAGSQLLRDQSGKTKFYRLNPVHASMPVRHAKEARVIFAVEDGLLGIFSITADHDDYDQTVGMLLKAKL